MCGREQNTDHVNWTGQAAFAKNLNTSIFLNLPKETEEVLSLSLK